MSPNETAAIGERIAHSGRIKLGAPVDPWPDDERTDVGTFPGDAEHQEEAEPTSWEPLDLRPYLRGEIAQPEPTIGAVRSDGQRFLYPGREHAVLGETESGKSWLALACVAAELAAGHRVVYLHYEEPDATSTVERLRLLGVAPDLIETLLAFVAPERPVRSGWLADLLTPAPTLVVHDGVNEAMVLHGQDVNGVDGGSGFRRLLVTPFLRVGAATLACDHVPKNGDRRSRDAYGTVHKGNAINGARFMLDNVKPFGKGLRGVSHVFVTKDRPGRLRVHGKPSEIPGKTFFGTLTVDGTGDAEADVLAVHAPRDDDNDPVRDPASELARLVYDTIAAQDGGVVAASRTVYALLRQQGLQHRDSAVRSALDDLVVSGRLVEIPGKRGARGYRAVPRSAGEQ